MTLEEFLRHGPPSEEERTHMGFLLEEPGFAALGVDFGWLRDEDGAQERLFILCEVDAEETGKGTFTNLLLRLRREHPELHLLVEKVIDPGLVAYLLKAGFQEVGTGLPHDYLLRADAPLALSPRGTNGKAPPA